MSEKNLKFIEEKLKRGEQIPPLLFVGEDLTKANIDALNLAKKLFEKHKVDKNNLFQISDSWEKIKVEEARQLTSKANNKPSWLFQIFLIENASRLTIQSSNSMLKFLEEPGIWNIIFLTNKWENGVLDTILSRVHTLRDENRGWLQKNDFYYHQIDKLIKEKDSWFLGYIFKEKLEKNEYLELLKTLIIYSKENFVFQDLLNKMEEAINIIEKNNVLPKYKVDTILFEIAEWIKK